MNDVLVKLIPYSNNEMEVIEANVLVLWSKVDRNCFSQPEFANGADPYPTLSPINRIQPEVFSFKRPQTRRFNSDG